MTDGHAPYYGDSLHVLSEGIMAESVDLKCLGLPLNKEIGVLS